MYFPWINRRFGVELEFRDEHPRGTRLTEAELRYVISVVTTRLNHAHAHYYRSTGGTWDIKTDATCGWEVATPAITLDEHGQNEEMRNVVAAINTLRPKVDRKCGLHVHLDCSDLSWNDVQAFLTLWARYEPFFYEIQPKQRRRSAQCKPLNRIAWNEAYADVHWHIARAAMRATNSISFQTIAGSLDRRMSFNVSRWWTTGRIEIRLGAGTLDYNIIRFWVMLLLSTVARAAHRQLPRPKPVENWTTSQYGPSTEYIAQALCLRANRIVREVAPETAPLVTWLDERRRYHRRRETADMQQWLRTVRTARGVIGRPEQARTVRTMENPSLENVVSGQFALSRDFYTTSRAVVDAVDIAVGGAQNDSRSA
jgi:hypothetical protein